MERYTIVIHINEIINRAYGIPIGGLLWVVAVSFMLQGIASAQTELPPIIGDTLWTYTGDGNYNSPSNNPWGPWHALAEDAKVLYRVHWSDITVHDATTGKVKDVIGIREVFNNTKARPRRVYSNSWGTRLVVQYIVNARRGGDSLITSLISYPERNVIKEVQFEGESSLFGGARACISPDGRWFVAASRSNGHPYTLYDSKRDKSFPLDIGGGSWSFDSSSRYMAVRNYILDLAPDEPAMKSLNYSAQLGDSQLSADGRFLISRTTREVGLSSWPQITVFECVSGRVVWQINGGWEWEGGPSPMRDDLVSFAISGDGRVVYAYRNDTVNGKVLDEGFFYRIPDTIPMGRSKNNTSWGYSPDANTSSHIGFATFSRDLTRSYTAPLYPSSSAYPCWLLAMRFDELVTSIPEGGPTNPEQPALYPNPTTGAVTVRWDWPDEKVHWQVASPTGQLVDFGSAAAVGNAVRIVLASDLAAGRYSLLLRNAHAEHVQHFTLIKN